MKRINSLTVLLFTGFLLACNPESQLQKELDFTRSQLEVLQEELNMSRSANNVRLMHLVFLPLKKDLTDEQLRGVRESLNSLRTIPEVRLLKLGDLADSQDPRLMKGYPLVMHTGFENLEDLKKYDANESHLQVRRDLAAFLQGTPVTFDYWLEKQK